MGRLAPSNGSEKYPVMSSQPRHPVQPAIRYPGLDHHASHAPAAHLRRFKQVLETGEVVRSEGSPEGSKAQRLMAQRLAQPVTS